MRMRAVLEDTPTHFLKDTNAYEQAFWENLRAVCLEPDLKAFGLEGEVKSEWKTFSDVMTCEQGDCATRLVNRTSGHVYHLSHH